MPCTMDSRSVRQSLLAGQPMRRPCDVRATFEVIRRWRYAGWVVQGAGLDVDRDVGAGDRGGYLGPRKGRMERCRGFLDQFRIPAL